MRPYIIVTCGRRSAQQQHSKDGDLVWEWPANFADTLHELVDERGELEGVSLSDLASVRLLVQRLIQYSQNASRRT